MASIEVFCTEEELTEWVQLLCEAHGLAGLVFQATDSPMVGKLVMDASKLSIRENTFRVFLFPKAASPTEPLEMKDTQPRKWGWVDVDPGHLFERGGATILLLSVICGEDFDVEPIHPARYIHWLRRKLRKQTFVGVKIRSEDSPGERIVRDIRYSKQALLLYRSGVIWKQATNDKTFFTPIEDKDDPVQRIAGR